jgi:hypothetical protein
VPPSRACRQPRAHAATPAAPAPGCLYCTWAEVLVVAAREAEVDAVVVVEHGGDAVEAEAVEAQLLHPVAQVGEQVAQRLVAAVVEQAGVPQGVVPRLALREQGARGGGGGGSRSAAGGIAAAKRGGEAGWIAHGKEAGSASARRCGHRLWDAGQRLVCRPPRSLCWASWACCCPSSVHLLEVVGVLGLAQVEAGEAVVRVGGDVGVHDVQQHVDAQAVGLVDERLELLRGACGAGRPCTRPTVSTRGGGAALERPAGRRARRQRGRCAREQRVGQRGAHPIARTPQTGW